MANLLIRHFFPNHPSFGFEALRAAGYASIGAADIGEVIYICSRIPEGDERSWFREWNAAAERAITNAKISLTRSNKIGAREAFLRASNYYRTAEFYRRQKPFEDEVAKAAANSSSEAFYSAAKLMDYVVEKCKIPYEGTTLPGTLMLVDNIKKPRPLIIVNGGFDSTREEIGWSVAAAALQQGFNVLAFDGPGQGDALREQRLFFRHDWEKVITPVVDYSLSLPFVDNGKLVIMGVSMGGYLVGRAVAFEHRAAAVVVNDGVYDFGSAFRDKNPAIGKFLLKYNWDATMNAAMRMFMRWDTGFKWGILNAMWTFGLSSEVDVLRAVDAYTLHGLVGMIKTPMLVLEAPDDHFLKGQPAKLFNGLLSEKHFAELKREEGASAHCHMGAGSRLNQVVFDFLVGKLKMA